MSHMNSILDMIGNEDADTLSRIVVVNNETNNRFIDVDEVQEDGFGDETEALNEDGDEIVNEFQAWMGKEKAIERVFGNWDDSYTALPKFLSALQHCNRESVVEWFVTRLGNNQVEFIRVFGLLLPLSRDLSTADLLLALMPLICTVVNEEGSPWLEPRGFHR
nr:hypothetical protein [Tanacetum cinerariifolium]